jgi:hypothetical protein
VVASLALLVRGWLRPHGCAKSSSWTGISLANGRGAYEIVQLDSKAVYDAKSDNTPASGFGRSGPLEGQVRRSVGPAGRARSAVGRVRWKGKFGGRSGPQKGQGRRSVGPAGRARSAVGWIRRKGKVGGGCAGLSQSASSPCLTCCSASASASAANSASISAFSRTGKKKPLTLPVRGFPSLFIFLGTGVPAYWS